MRGERRGRSAALVFFNLSDRIIGYLSLLLIEERIVGCLSMLLLIKKLNLAYDVGLFTRSMFCPQKCFWVHFIFI